MSVPRAAPGAEARRGMARPPSPCLEAMPRALQHELCAPVDGSPEARLEALERQQKADHILFNAIKSNLDSIHKVTTHVHNQVKAGERTRAEHTEMGVQLRKELYMVRDKLGGDIKTVADAVSTEVPKLLAQQIAAAMAKIEIIDGHVQILQQQSAGLSESNTKMTKYLEELHSERPREGAVVAEAFGQVKNEVNRVRDLVQQIEQKPGQVMAQNVFQGEILTKEMLATLCDMHQKILNLDQVYGSYNAMFARVEQTHVLTEALSTSCAEFTQRILTLEENIPLPAHGADYGASLVLVLVPCGSTSGRRSVELRHRPKDADKEHAAAALAAPIPQPRRGTLGALLLPRVLQACRAAPAARQTRGSRRCLAGMASAIASTSRSCRTARRPWNDERHNIKEYLTLKDAPIHGVHSVEFMEQKQHAQHRPWRHGAGRGVCP